MQLPTYHLAGSGGLQEGNDGRVNGPAGMVGGEDGQGTWGGGGRAPGEELEESTWGGGGEEERGGGGHPMGAPVHNYSITLLGYLYPAPATIFLPNCQSRRDFLGFSRNV